MPRNRWLRVAWVSMTMVFVVCVLGCSSLNPIYDLLNGYDDDYYSQSSVVTSTGQQALSAASAGAAQLTVVVAEAPLGKVKVAGATVTALAPQGLGTATATTGADGTAVFTAGVPQKSVPGGVGGAVTVRVEKAGFRPVTQDVPVSSDQPSATVTVQLRRTAAGRTLPEK